MGNIEMVVEEVLQYGNTIKIYCFEVENEQKN